ncbi:hypothetical protein L7F22_015412 [Adiantum nelumboides]|nr:hypothetical protein [Adiantum nelumboides]
MWEEADIYNYCIKSLAAKRKWKKRKSIGSNTSSTATSLFGDNMEQTKAQSIHNEVDDSENCASISKMLSDNLGENTLPAVKVATTTVQEEDVYVSEMTWENSRGTECDAYEEYHNFFQKQDLSATLESTPLISYSSQDVEIIFNEAIAPSELKQVLTLIPCKQHHQSASWWSMSEGWT